MKKSFLILLLFFSFFTYTASSQIFAAAPATVGAEGNPQCKCTNPDSMAGGANGFTCPAGITMTQPNCAAGSYCQNGPAGNTPMCKNGKIGAAGVVSCTSLHDTCGNGLPPCCGADAVCGTDGHCVTNDPNNPLANSPLATQPSPPPPPCEQPVANGGCTSVLTAFGTWSTEPAGFIQKLFGVLLGFAGGIAVLIIIISGYRMIMSKGDPEKTAAAREALTAAIVGLLFLIFSFVILQVIGFDLLRIPGFGG